MPIGFGILLIYIRKKYVAELELAAIIYVFPFVNSFLNRPFRDIDKKKTELYRYPPNSYALRKAMKEFYYQHIYHTVALEGNTLTIEEIRKIIDSRRAVPNKSIYEHNEVNDIKKFSFYAIVQ